MNMNFNDKEEEFIFEEEDLDTSADETDTEDNLLLKVQKLKKELQVALKERKEYLDGWQRIKADYLNSKKRYDEERIQIKARTEENAIEKILPLCDSFDMALAHINGEQEGALKTGFTQIHGQLISILSSFKVTEIKAIGEKFDPYKHEALSTTPVDSEEQHNTVITVLQKGYMREDSVLRPAKVIIGEFKG